MTSRAPLLPLVRRYIERDPASAARGIETMEEADAAAVLSALPPPAAAGVFSYLDVSRSAALLKAMPPEIFRAIVERLSPQQAAAILTSLPADARQTVLGLLPEVAKRDVQELLTYPLNSAGRIMTTDFVAFHTDVKVKDVVQRLRSLANRHAPLTYTYVVDAQNRLVGVLNMRDLLLAAGDASVESIMRTDVFAVSGFLDREELAHELSRRRYLAAPVVDPDRRLLGVVKTDQLIADVQEEATEDIQKMVGAGGDERAFSPVAFSLRKRLPWLHINLLTAFLAAAVVGMFEDVIARITLLAVLLPVVAGQGGNAGAQSLAVVIRGLVMREIPPEHVRRFVLKEGAIGLLNGVATGAVAGLVAWLWHGNPFIGIVIALAMVVNLLAAGLSGAAIPLAMKAAGQDPAQSSSIILTTITDCVGYFAFLGFAVLFQRFLL